MASKQVTDREKSSRAVASAVTTHAASIHTNLSAALAPFLLKGEKMPDVALFLQLVGRQIEAATAHLVAADKAHDAELADDAAPREQRDAAVEAVRGVLIDLRAAVESAHGAAGLKALGIDAAVPDDPQALASTADAVVVALGDSKIKLGAGKRRGLKLDREEFAKELRTDLPALHKALRDVSREEREAEVTLTAKWTAMANSDRAFTRGAQVVSVTAALAGLDEIAARVRPSGRRPGQTASTEESTSEGGDKGGEGADKAADKGGNQGSDQGVDKASDKAADKGADKASDKAADKGGKK